MSESGCNLYCMAEIHRKNGTIFIDDEDLPLLDNVSVTVHVTTVNRVIPYFTVHVKLPNGKRTSLGRYLLNPPKGMVVDHINGNTLDNRRENLRVITTQQNNARKQPNGRPANPEGYKGVRGTDSGRWRSMIVPGGRFIHLGTSDNRHWLALLYNQAASILNGEYVWLNEVPCYSESPVMRNDKCAVCNAVCHCCCVCGDDLPAGLQKFLDEQGASLGLTA